MDLSRFTQKAQQAVLAAQRLLVVVPAAGARALPLAPGRGECCGHCGAAADDAKRFGHCAGVERFFRRFRNNVGRRF